MNPSRLRPRSGSALLLLALLAGAGCATRVAPTPPPAAALPPPPAPPTHVMARPPAKAKPTLDAVFEAVAMAPLKLEPKAWTDLTVIEVVPHGARVKRGDTLVKLDTEKLKEQIEELERDQPAAALASELATAELENLEQTTPLKLEAARRAQRNASQDLDYFNGTGRAAKEKSADHNIKNSQQRLEGAREELKQLEKMYKADDLVEDTEEIILKRQKFAVESAEYGLEVARQGADWSLKHAIPREGEQLQAGQRDQELALALLQQTAPRTLAKKRLDVEKLKRDQTKAEKRLGDLRKDLELLSAVRSPLDGLVYYGACEGGRWTTGAAVAKKLVPSGKLTANEVFLTVANPERLALRAVIQEGDLSHFDPGLEGQAVPSSTAGRKLPVKIEELGSVPLPSGGFEAKLSLQPGTASGLVPGMNCKVTFPDTRPPDPLRAPKEAVFSDSGGSFVFVLKGEGPPEKRRVKTGSGDDKTLEILEGLAEGEKILLTRPH